MLLLPLKRIIRYLIIGVLLLVFGGHALSLIVSIVLLFRLGNPLPAIVVIGLMFFLSWFEGHVRLHQIIHRVVRMITLVAVGFTAVTTFFICLGFGYAVAVAAPLVLVILAAVMNDWSGLQSFFSLKFMVPRKTTGMGLFAYLLNSDPPANTEIMITSSDSFDLLFRLIASRPLLPISLVVYRDFVAIVFRIDDPTLLSKTHELLRSWSIDLAPPSTLLARAIIAGPALIGLSESTEYMLSSDPDTIAALVERQIPGMIVTSSSGAIAVAVPSENAIGMTGVPVSSSIVATAFRNQMIASLVMNDV
ncbi:MAG: hypothetical protein K9W43_04585 [Candidatus Thorarchaeota archaeon]|nr:hypothetical protein [Candidatus Thorarchaeota archaeon]